MNCQGCDNEIMNPYTSDDHDCDIWWCENCGSIAIDCKVDGISWDSPKNLKMEG